jgi:hypothetical protein
MAPVGTHTLSFVGPITANIIVAHSIIELERLEIARYKAFICTVKLVGGIVGTGIGAWLVRPVRTVAKVVIDLIKPQLDLRMVYTIPVFFVIFHAWFVQVKTPRLHSPDSVDPDRKKGNCYQWCQKHV